MQSPFIYDKKLKNFDQKFWNVKIKLQIFITIVFYKWSRAIPSRNKNIQIIWEQLSTWIIMRICWIVKHFFYIFPNQCKKFSVESIL